jgi:fructokinase
LAIASLDDEGAATYQFLIDGTSSLSVTPEIALNALDGKATALHIGTLAFVFEPLSQATRAVVAAMNENQLLMVDPNARPSVMRDPSQFWETFNEALDRADVIKFSGDDLDYMFPDLSNQDAARDVCRRSQAVVLLTDGSKGVHVFMHTEEFHVNVPEIHVVDTVGAGDAFSGGFLSYWDKHNLGRDELANTEEVRAAVEFGIKVAGLTCQRVGAMPPFAHELD